MNRYIYSSSLLSRAACLSSLQRYFAGEEGTRPAIHANLRTGVVFHRAAEAYNEWLLQVRKETDWEEADRFLQTAFDEADDLSGEQIMDLQAVWRGHVRRWSLDPERALGVERAICLDRGLRLIEWDPRLDYDGGAMHEIDLDRPDAPFVRGKVDYAEIDEDGVPLIHDYKTAYGVPNQTTVEASLQPKLYAWLASVALVQDAPEYRVVLDFVRWGTTRTVTYGLPELQEFEADLLVWIARIEEADPDAPPTQCSYCDLCEYRRGCSAWPDEPMIGVPEDAPDVLAELLRLEARRKELIAALKTHTAEAGPVVLADQAWGPVVSESWAYDVQGVIDYLMSQDEDPARFLSVNARAVKKLGRDRLEELRMVAGKTVARTNYKTHKATGASVAEVH